MAEPQEVKSRREQLSERLKAKYPDKEYADDEALFGQINDDYDAYDGELSGYKERESALVDMLNKDPRSAQFITAMARGADPWSELIKRIGVDGMTEILEDPEKQAEYETAQKEYLERVAKSKELDEQWERNMEESRSTVSALQSEGGISDEDMDRALDMLGEISGAVLMGKFSREHIELALKALNHERAIEEASQEGEVRGRNAKIDAKLRKREQGDGVPMLGGRNNSPREKSQAKSVFELAAEAQ